MDGFLYSKWFVLGDFWAPYFGKCTFCKDKLTPSENSYKFDTVMKQLGIVTTSARTPRPTGRKAGIVNRKCQRTKSHCRRYWAVWQTFSNTRSRSHWEYMDTCWYDCHQNPGCTSILTYDQTVNTDCSSIFSVALAYSLHHIRSSCYHDR